MNKSLLLLFLINTVSAIPTEQLAPGISYRHISKAMPHPLSIHVVEVTKNSSALSLVHAQGNGLSREPVSSIGKRTNALVAINAGNYRRGGQFNGNPVGFLQIKDTIYSDPWLARALLCIAPDNLVSINKIKRHWQLAIGDKMFPVDKINQPRAQDDAILYNRSFGKNTFTNTDGTEIVVSNGKIIAINYNAGNSPIPKNGFVYSVEKRTGVNLSTASVGSPAYLTSTMEPAMNIEHAVSGSGILIQNGNIVENFHADFWLDFSIVHSGDEIAADFQNKKERAWLIEECHPRTALGIKADQTVVLVVVDGRQPGFSEGMNFTELANLLSSLGCIDAVNLGGGGCTTLYVKGKGVLNSPAVSCDPKQTNIANFNERPVSDALVVVAKTE